MSYKRLRQSRYDDLRTLGFLPFEARILSVIPRDIPYMKNLAEKRYGEFKAFLRQKNKITGERKTEKEFKTRILKRYYMKGWSPKGWNRSNKKDISNAVYAMLKTFEKPYKKKHKKYRSPNIKKRRDYQATRSKISKTIKAELPKWIAGLKKQLSQATTDERKVSLQGQINALVRRYGNA